MLNAAAGSLKDASWVTPVVPIHPPMAMAMAMAGPLLVLAAVVAAAAVVVAAGALVILDLQVLDRRVESALVCAGTASHVVMQLACSLDGKDFTFWELNTF